MTTTTHIPGFDEPIELVVRRTLSRAEWEAARQTHAVRFNQIVLPHAQRRSRHEKDPTADFLFEYYRFRPARLREWHPGAGVLLADADLDEDSDALFTPVNGYVRVEGGIMQAPGPDSISNPKAFLRGTRWIHTLLKATHRRVPLLGCFGLHEWAMLYRSDSTRHDQVPLRISHSLLQETVESVGLRCSHYDAFRFFTPDARPLNPESLTRESMPEKEQPGCLHANMDVYRWAFKRAPWIGSDLIMDAFELALDIRTLDMASSPYDLSGWGIVPVPVETNEGRAAFVKAQRDFQDRAYPLRQRLITDYDYLLYGMEALHDCFAIPVASS